MPAPLRRALCLLAILVCLSSLTLSVATAQPEGPIRIELLGQPVWHAADDELGLRLRIANEGPATLDGLRLQIRLFRVATSRSDLEANFEVEPTSIEIGSTPVELLDTAIAAGSSVSVTVEEPLTVFEALAPVTEGGVYPLTVTVTDAAGLTALDTLTTQLLYFPSEVEVPLNLVLVWPLSDLPSRGREGVFLADPDTGAIPLEAALEESGWLRGVLDALSTRAGEELRMGLAPLPRVVDEVRDMADGYRRSVDGSERTVEREDPTSQAATSVLESLGSLLGGSNLQPILVPYSFADVPMLGDLEQTNAQLNEGEDVLEAAGVSPGRAWLFPPAGRLDEPTLERLRSADAAASTFLSQDALEPLAIGEAGCREDFEGITHTCPVAVKNPIGNARAYVLDPGLQQRFSALVNDPRDATALQRLFAEIAMIWAELPGVGERVIALAVPPLWHPPPATAARFVRTLARAPWIRTVTPRGGLHLGIGALERELVPDLPQAAESPDDLLFEEIAEATAMVESFARIRPPEGLVSRLRRDVMVAQSRLWWGRDPELAAAFADGVRTEVEEQLELISIGGRDDITLTSRRGEVPLVFINDTGYDVTVDIRLESSNRDLEIVEPVISDTFEPGVSPLSIEASARSSGIFQVWVRVETSDGTEVFANSISIRSTEFNEIALGLTVGALAFLVMFAVFRGVRAGRGPQDRASDIEIGG